MTTWTVVIRKSKFSQFTKTGFEGTWREALEEAQRIYEADPALADIHMVTTDDTTVETEEGKVINIMPTREEKAAAKVEQERQHRAVEEMRTEGTGYAFTMAQSAARRLGLGEFATPLAAAYALAEAGHDWRSICRMYS